MYACAWTACPLLHTEAYRRAPGMEGGRPCKPCTSIQHAPLHPYGPVPHMSQPRYSAMPTRRAHTTTGSSHLVHETLYRDLYRARIAGEWRAGVRGIRRYYRNRCYGRSQSSSITHPSTGEPTRWPLKSMGSDAVLSLESMVQPHTA